ncbi:MAG: DUF2726 domain-containing protein [Planctomycetota bacterium]
MVHGHLLNSDDEAFLYEYVKDRLDSTCWETHPNVSLRQLVGELKRSAFTRDEWDFIMSPSRVDVATSTGDGKRRVTLALESDSSLHDSQVQKQRDKLKDGILGKLGVPLMRFRPRIHYQPNKFDERFIDAVLDTIGNHQFYSLILEGYLLGRKGKLKCLDARDAKQVDGLLEKILVPPYRQEFEELLDQAAAVAAAKGGLLKLLDEWEWDDEDRGVCYSRQILLYKIDTRRLKPLTAATGRCAEQEFLYGAYAAAEQVAQMACLYKYLVNEKVCSPEERPFLNFLDDRRQRPPAEVLEPLPW